MNEPLKRKFCFHCSMLLLILQNFSIQKSIELVFIEITSFKNERVPIWKPNQKAVSVLCSNPLHSLNSFASQILSIFSIIQYWVHIKFFKVLDECELQFQIWWRWIEEIRKTSTQSRCCTGRIGLYVGNLRRRKWSFKQKVESCKRESHHNSSSFRSESTFQHYRV